MHIRLYFPVVLLQSILLLIRAQVETDALVSTSSTASITTVSCNNYARDEQHSGPRYIKLSENLYLTRAFQRDGHARQLHLRRT